MKLTLNTAQFYYSGPDRVDITMKATGVGAVLAPTWEMVAGVKKYLNPDDDRWKSARVFLPEDYNREYIKLLRDRFREDEQPFIDLFEFGKLHGSLTLVCYCPDGQFCHRHTALEEILIPLAEHYGIDLTRGDIK